MSELSPDDHHEADRDHDHEKPAHPLRLQPVDEVLVDAALREVSLLHLLQAVAWEVRRRMPQAQILYLTAERFRFSFVEALQSKEAMAFKVLIGYEVLVLVRPPDAEPELVVQRDGRKLHVENRGRSSTLVRKLEYCESLPSGACEELPGNRLYAGEVWDVELPGEGAVRMHQTYRTENSVQAY